MASLAPTPTSGYRGRLAPSPTGYLHVGHARTFWTAWQRAREAGGALVMRMEDLDPERSKPIFAEAALDDLRWLGIRWLEGPDKGGPFAPYVQSKRRAIYLAAWRRLLRRGCLFPCRCSRKDLESALGAPHESSSPGPAAEPRQARAAGRRADLSRHLPAVTCGALRNCPAPPPATSRCPTASTGDSACAKAKWSSSTIRTWAAALCGRRGLWRLCGVAPRRRAQLPACLRGRRRGHGHHGGGARRGPAQVHGAADSALPRLGSTLRPGTTAGWWWTTTAAAWPSATTR